MPKKLFQLFCTILYACAVLLLFIFLSQSTSYATSAPLPKGQSGKWHMIFHDEFSSDILDSTKWTSCYWWVSLDKGCSNSSNGELEWYQPYNVVLNTSSLQLIAQKQSIIGANGSVYNYTSGMISSGRIGSDLTIPSKFSFTYGYIEARIIVPKGQGLWPAFWLIPDDQSWPPEIDIMEILGQNTTSAYLTTYWKNPDGTTGQDQSIFTGPDFSTAWHTFGLDWKPTSITWYIDGIARKTVTNAYEIPSKALYLVANLAVGGYWAGAPDGKTPFPSYYKIDYIRVWQR